MRIEDIEQRRGVGGGRDHVSVLEVAAGESVAGALARIGRSDATTIGIVAPADATDVAQWEREASALMREIEKGKR